MKIIAAVPAQAAAAAAPAVLGEVGEQGAGDWHKVPAGTCTAGTMESLRFAGCAIRAPASELLQGGGGCQDASKEYHDAPGIYNGQ